MVDQTKLALLGIYLSVFSHSLMYSTLFPVIGEVITNYKPDSPIFDQGLWLGKISLFFFLGEFLSFPLQIWLSGKLGNRLLHLLSIISTVFFSLLLSYSTTYDSISTIRFFQGFCCPVIYSSKKLIREYFAKNPQKGENYIQRFVLIGISAGFLIGGLMNGIEIMGCTKYFSGNFSVLVFGIISFALCLKYGKAAENQASSSIFVIIIEIVQVFKIPGFLKAGTVYLLCSIGGVGFEIAILLMLARREDGGFHLIPDDMWKILFLYSTFVYVFLFVWFEDIVAKLGKIQACRDSLKFCAICMLIFPLFSLSNRSYTSMYLALIGGNFLYFTSLFIAENTLLALLSQLSEKDSLVQAKELGFAIGKLCRAVSAYCFCWSFSIHIKEKSFPFDFSYTFIVLSVILLFTNFACKLLKEVLNPPSHHYPNTETPLDRSETLEIPSKSNELQLISSKP